MNDSWLSVGNQFSEERLQNISHTYRSRMLLSNDIQGSYSFRPHNIYVLIINDFQIPRIYIRLYFAYL